MSGKVVNVRFLSIVTPRYFTFLDYLIVVSQNFRFLPNLLNILCY